MVFVYYNKGSVWSVAYGLVATVLVAVNDAG